MQCQVYRVTEFYVRILLVGDGGSLISIYEGSLGGYHNKSRRKLNDIKQRMKDQVDTLIWSFRRLFSDRNRIGIVRRE